MTIYKIVIFVHFQIIDKPPQYKILKVQSYKLKSLQLHYTNITLCGTASITFF